MFSEDMIRREEEEAAKRRTDIVKLKMTSLKNIFSEFSKKCINIVTFYR